MRKSISASLLAFGLSCIFAGAQEYYTVSVKTYVGTALEDQFSFNIQPGKTEKKGFECRLYAKGYQAQGFEHPLLAEMEKKRAEEELAASIAKENANKKDYELIAEEAKKKSDELKNLINTLSRRSENTISRIEFLEKKDAALDKALEAIEKNPRSAKAVMEKFAQIYEKDFIDKDPVPVADYRRADTEEYDFGSYCEFTLHDVKAGSAIFEMAYAYSRILSWAYADGNNTGGGITKFPIFENYLKIFDSTQTVKLGEEYCIQFGRQDKKTATSLHEALQGTTLFSSNDASSRAQDAINSAMKIFKSNSSPLDAQGKFSEIRSRFGAQTSQTVRAVIKITPMGGGAAR